MAIQSVSEHIQGLIQKYEEQSGQPPRRLIMSSRTLEDVMRTIAPATISYSHYNLTASIMGLPVEINEYIGRGEILVRGDREDRYRDQMLGTEAGWGAQQNRLAQMYSSYINSAMTSELAQQMMQYAQQQTSVPESIWTSAQTSRINHTHPNTDPVGQHIRQAVDEGKTQVSAKITVPEAPPIVEPNTAEIAKGCRPGVTEDDVRDLIESWRRDK